MLSYIPSFNYRILGSYALRIVRILRLTGIRSRTSSRSGISYTSTLSIVSLASATAGAAAGRAGRGSSVLSGSGAAAARVAELGLDKGKCLLAIDADVFLMMRSVTAVAAVRIYRVAVRLDSAGIGADKVGGASIKLKGVRNVSAGFGLNIRFVLCVNELLTPPARHDPTS